MSPPPRGVPAHGCPSPHASLPGVPRPSRSLPLPLRISRLPFRVSPRPRPAPSVPSPGRPARTRTSPRSAPGLTPRRRDTLCHGVCRTAPLASSRRGCQRRVVSPGSANETHTTAEQLFTETWFISIASGPACDCRAVGGRRLPEQGHPSAHRLGAPPPPFPRQGGCPAYGRTCRPGYGAARPPQGGSGGGWGKVSG